MTKRTYVSNAANKAAVGLARWVTKQRGQKGSGLTLQHSVKMI